MRFESAAYFAIFAIIISVAVIVGALSLDYRAIKTLPILIGGITLVLAIIVLFREMLSKKTVKVAEGTQAEGIEKETSLSSYWQTGACIAGFALLIYLLGFFIAIPIFITVYLSVNKMGWRKGIIIAIITTIALYAIFEMALQIRFYRGLLLSGLY